MDTMTMRFIVILTVFDVLQVQCDRSNKRSVNQLRKFKREMRADLTYIENDISTLFDTVDDLKKSGIIAIQDPRGNKTNEEGEKCAADFKEVIDEIAQINTVILKALESEKRLNRQLQNKVNVLESDMQINRQLQSKLQVFEAENQNKLKIFEDILSDIAVDMNTLMTYVNGTLHKPVYARLETTYCFKAKWSGVFGLYIQSRERTVYCDADTDGGGWIVIMRRQDGSVNFNRNWDDYKNGFGYPGGEFWIGNDLIHRLTKSKSMELRIDMEDHNGNTAYAKYSHFEIGSEAENYILHVSGYSGTAGDSLLNGSDPWAVHDGMVFTTRDNDNNKKCAGTYGAGWWYISWCGDSHLTGRYGNEWSFKGRHAISWYSWTGSERYPKYVDMKIR